MPLNLNVIGKELEAAAFTYTEDQVMLYALGIGACAHDLDFVYEKNLKVLPTFAVLPFMPVLLNVFVPEAGLNLFKVLHGEHQIVLHRPIPPSGTVYTTTICDSIYDKGDKGAMVNVRFKTRNAAGDMLFENRAVLIDRGAGNFGGERGPRTEPVDPPRHQAPDFTVSETIPANQAALYRLSGDKNPLHIDPAFAAKGGFDRPILQGLCTLGYAGRAILRNVCNQDPSRLASFALRFMHVVYPGDVLTTEGWKVDQGKYIIRTSNQEGKTVLGNAVAEIR